MAVIKSLLPSGCMDYNGIAQEDVSKETLLDRIKRLRELGLIRYKDSYIGDRGVLDVDISKIKCGSCRMELRRALGLGVERRTG